MAEESYLVMEAHSGRVLLASNSESKRSIASLTKVATAKVVLDWAKRSQTSLSTLVPVPQQALTLGALGSVNPMNLKPGDRLSMRDALYSMLLGSDNVAAYTLSDYVGRSLLAKRGVAGDPESAFVKEMNNLAKALGMGKTKFTNAHGLGSSKKAGYSTAADVARLSVYAMHDTGFTFYVKQKSRKVTVVNVNGGKSSFVVNNTNSLVGTQGINGIKTGYSTEAGQCITVNSHRSALVKKIGEGQTQVRKRDLIVSILGSTNREARAQQLIQQSWPLYDAWAAAGFQKSVDGKELILVPAL
ncbi:serine hydrolase [Akkermansiaceae bacterium]|nr:serine hydrolase [Akkermansiaceae bacterium]